MPTTLMDTYPTKSRAEKMQCRTEDCTNEMHPYGYGWCQECFIGGMTYAVEASKEKTSMEAKA